MQFRILFVGVLIFALSGCKVFHSSTAEKERKDQSVAMDTSIQLTEQDELRYEFAFIEGMKQKVLGNFSNALGYFYKCSEIDNKAAAPRYEISQINTMMGDNKAALEYANESVKLDPDNPWYRKHLANLFIKNKNFEDAML